MQAVLVLGIES
ncbi:unnamed protein product, partial [Diplocarpon coronariae]